MSLELRIFVVALAAMGVVYVGVGAMLPQQWQVETTETLGAPVAKVAIAGKDNSALAPTPAPAAAPAADLGGEEVFNMACMACHGAGVAGAPKMGDKAAWAARIAKGAETLHKHAIEGFQGSAGFMPPKGGRADLADKSIVNAVDYMVAQSK